MEQKFILEKGKHGVKVVVTSSWSDEITQFILDRDIKELHLNYARGWKGKDLSFLKTMSHLRCFSIIDWNIDDISPINYLHSLQSLEVSTYCKTEINFEQFPHLEDCFLSWRAKAKSIFNRKTLKRLFIYRYTKQDTSKFSNLTELESLRISVAPIKSLEGLKQLCKLKILGLYYLTKLPSLSGIEDLTLLEECEIKNCSSLTSINEIANLDKLKKLQICDNRDIDSLKLLEKLNKLEMVLFTGSTKIVDGDLSPLLKLKNLSIVSFQNRRHYSHKRSHWGE